jgi:hypothetical protein
MKSASPPRVLATVLALSPLGVAGGGCSSSSYDAAYYDPYVHYSYYPAEIYYSTFYWSDPYYFYYLDQGYASRATTVTADAGSTPNLLGRPAVGDALRALARGQDVCPSHVLIAPRMVPNPCPANASDMIRGGVEISFWDCSLPDGGTLNGDVEVETTRETADESCSSSTMVTITHTATVTNLSYSSPSGRRLVIPNQTATGSNTYVISQPPEVATAMLDGRMQLFGVDGALVTDRSYTGYVAVTPARDRLSYVIDATLTLSDADSSGTTDLTAMGLTRTSDCCHPTGGTLSATRSGERAFNLHVWSFNSSCSGASFDDRAITQGACL